MQAADMSTLLMVKRHYLIFVDVADKAPKAYQASEIEVLACRFVDEDQFWLSTEFNKLKIP